MRFSFQDFRPSENPIEDSVEAGRRAELATPVFVVALRIPGQPLAAFVLPSGFTGEAESVPASGSCPGTWCTWGPGEEASAVASPRRLGRCVRSKVR